MKPLSKASIAILDQLEIVTALRANPKSIINPQLASILLGVDERTLARHRMNGTGPIYIQPSSKPDSKALNQKVNYVVGDLIKWLEENKHYPRTDINIRHSFLTRSTRSFTNLVPFVICPEMKLHVPFHLMDINTLTTLIKHHLETVQIVYRSLKNCLLVEWSDPEIQNLIRDRYIGLFKQTVDDLSSTPKAFNNAEFIE